MHHLHFQHWPILVCAVFLWLLGATWYSPLLFARPWAAIVGRPMGEKPKGVVHGMIASLIGDLLLSFMLAHVVYWAHAHDFATGAFVGSIVWIGFVLAREYPQRIYEGRPFTYLAINAGYWLVGIVIAGGILGAWR